MIDKSLEEEKENKKDKIETGVIAALAVIASLAMGIIVGDPDMIGKI